MPRWALLVAVVPMAVLAVGCGSRSAGAPTGLETVAPAMVWPAPPDRPRIRFLEALASPGDMGIEPSFWQRLGELLAGRSQEWLVRPTGVAARGSIIYVADPGAPALWILDAKTRRIRKVREADGRLFVSPVAVTPGPGDHVYVADSALAKVFRYSGDGTLRATIEHGGFRQPAGLSYEQGRDRLYVADSGAHRIWVLSGDGGVIETIGRRGVGDGEFNFPTHLAVDGEGTLYVTDALGFRIQFFSADGAFAGKFGSHGRVSGNFASPKGVAVDREGHVYVVEALFDAVQIFDRQGSYLLSFGERGVGPGQFWLPNGLFIDERDRIYVADAYNERIQIFQYLAGGNGA